MLATVICYNGYFLLFNVIGLRCSHVGPEMSGLGKSGTMISPDHIAGQFRAFTDKCLV